MKKLVKISISLILFWAYVLSALRVYATDCTKAPVYGSFISLNAKGYSNNV